MISELEDSDQLELWPPKTVDAVPVARKARSSSGATSTPAPRQQPGTGRIEPAHTPDPSSTALPATANNDGERLWSIAEVAHYLGVTKDTIYGWRKSGYGPPARKIGKHLRWRTNDVSEWVDRLRETAPSATE